MSRRRSEVLSSGRVRKAGFRTLAATMTIALFVLGAAVVANAATITSAGPLTNVTTSPDLNCAVNHSGDSAGEWFANTACGTLVVVGNNLFGPASIPAGGGATGSIGYIAYTPVSQTGPTGTGTSGNPFKVVTVVGLGTTGLQVTQTDTYVVGQETYRTDVVLSKAAGVAVNAIIYRAGDCFLQNSDFGLGVINGSAITCKALPTSADPNRIEQLFPLTAGQPLLRGQLQRGLDADRATPAVPGHVPLQRADRQRSGSELGVTLAAGAANTTVSSLTAFSPVGAQPLSVTKTADATPVNPSASDGYTITVSNPGAVPATLSSISDTLPAGFTYTPGSTTGVTTANPSISASTLTWNGPFTVPAATNSPGTVTLHFGVTVSSVPATYTNSATANGDGLTVVPSGPTAPIVVSGVAPPPNQPTTCVVTGLRKGPPAQQDVTVRDPDGIAVINHINVINGSTHVPTFTPGTPGPLVLTTTKINQTQRTFWEFDVTDSRGVTKHCV